METRELFKQYYRKLSLEGWIKAFVAGFIVGFIGASILAIVALFINFFNLSTFVAILISCAVFVGIAALSAPIFYFLLFKPTSQQIAERVDRLGLDERAITMLELSKDESYIAMRQREDAKSHIQNTSGKKLKLAIIQAFKVQLIVLAVVAVASFSLVITAVATTDDPIEYTGGGKIVEDDEKYTFYTVNYEVEGGGFIYGDLRQLVIPDMDASAVVPVADIGWMFAGWSDNYPSATRVDKKVSANINAVAIFIEEPEAEPTEPPQPPSDSGDLPDPNKIDNGETSYRDRLDEQYNAIMDMIARGEIPSAEQQAFLQYYLSTIL